ncbi:MULTISPECIES: hypothetical protein [Streptomycetaceae]|uniref:hypothetical protein n=1 Tax=Streptomycetaceae TaxID=2062 RepID=UPI00093DC237|nr:hypothetical protein [Streptomyces sp. CB02056]OKH97562.1 hypothetical protein AMK13_38370 [Streptomyces sp. CB02056]
MTTKRPDAALPDLAALAVAALGEQIARAAWAVYGHRVLAVAGPAVRGLADGTRAAAGTALRGLSDEVRAIGADTAADLLARSRTAVGDAARGLAEDLCDRFGRAVRDAVTGGAR